MFNAQVILLFQRTYLAPLERYEQPGRSPGYQQSYFLSDCLGVQLPQSWPEPMCATLCTMSDHSVSRGNMHVVCL